MLYSLDEIVLIPSDISYIDSRSQCNPYKEGKLPLFIAPMCCLVDERNHGQFDKLGFNVIIPRTVSWDVRRMLGKQGKWIAVGLEEVTKILEDPFFDQNWEGKVCIDIANGHQRRSYECCSSLKKTYPKINIMVGNIANPESYKLYANAGADYIRLGIGSGQVCTTSVQTGIHYPMASLISKCFEYQKNLRTMGQFAPKIVADGGFAYIDQIVKAIALGADYVMLGRIAASFPEACGEIVDGKREYYGMSTEKAQRKMHPEPGYVPKHTEGTVRYVNIIKNTQTWIDDFTHALKSSMSYCNAKHLWDYRGQVEWDVQSPVTFNAYIKS